jgi:protein-S-isoprenylcysteine O-methyltransferase Ste14
LRTKCGTSRRGCIAFAALRRSHEVLSNSKPNETAPAAPHWLSSTGGIDITAAQTAKFAGFILGSICLVYFSRKALRVPRSHGFYRFFAWECLWGIFLLNVAHWFERPWSLPQLVSWLLLTISGLLVIVAFRFLKGLGQTDQRREDGALIGIEKTTVLVTRGPYRFIRHPMYSSLLLLTWGIVLKQPTVLASVLGALTTGLLVATARAEEAEDVQFFGEPYRQYMKRTKRFLPFLF